MKHAGILATTPDGAALCFRAFCQDGFAEPGPHDHPDVTLDCIALARSLPAWQAGDYATVRATLSVSAGRLAAAGADFFACPDNTAHLALHQPGPSLPLPGLHIAEVVAGQAARDGRQRVGVLGTGHTMTGPVYRQALAARHIATEIPSAHDRAVLDEIIISELVNGVFTGPPLTSRSAAAPCPPGAAARHDSLGQPGDARTWTPCAARSIRCWPAPFVECSSYGQFGTTPFTSCPQYERYRGEKQNRDDQPFCRSVAAVRIDPENGLYPVMPEDGNDGDDSRDRAEYGF